MSNLKIWLAFGIGGFIGGFVGYKYAMSKAQKIADKQVEDTKNALKNYYENKIEKINASTKDDDKDEVKEEKNDLGVDPEINDVIDKKVENPRERFPKSSKQVQPRSEVKNPVSDVMKRPNDLPPTAIDTPDGYPDPEDKKAPPYYIREKDYGEIDDWDTLDLILWECGTVTTDDSMCEMVSPTLLLRLLPDGWPNMFGWDGSDVLCVRNNSERRDIQIVKDHRTYKSWLEDVYPGRLNEIDDE